MDKHCSYFDACCQGCKRQQATAAKMPQILRSVQNNSAAESHWLCVTSLVLAKSTKCVGRFQHIFDIKVMGNYLNTDAFITKTSFWHLLPINACALAQPIFLIILKCCGCMNDQTWLWKCWLLLPEMGICKEAVNWKHLEIYQEFKHILKGHLCTKGNHSDSVLVLGTAAEVQVVTLCCNQHLLQLCCATARPHCAGSKSMDSEGQLQTKS